MYGGGVRGRERGGERQRDRRNREQDTQRERQRVCKEGGEGEWREILRG